MLRGGGDELLYPPEAVTGVLYIARNPFDVAVSLAHHLQTSLPEAVRIMSDDDYRFCSEPDEATGLAISPNFPHQTGSWSGHVVSWLDEARHRCLLLRYEDLL